MSNGGNGGGIPEIGFFFFFSQGRKSSGSGPRNLRLGKEIPKNKGKKGENSNEKKNEPGKSQRKEKNQKKFQISFNSFPFPTDFPISLNPLHLQRWILGQFRRILGFRRIFGVLEIFRAES